MKKGVINIFPSLRAEMARLKITKDDIAICLGIAEQTARYKLSGKYLFNIKEMKKIKAELFPTFSLDYLFSEDIPIAK
jgi:hypothetical protein